PVTCHGFNWSWYKHGPADGCSTLVWLSCTAFRGPVGYLFHDGGCCWSHRAVRSFDSQRTVTHSVAPAFSNRYARFDCRCCTCSYYGGMANHLPPDYASRSSIVVGCLDNARGALGHRLDDRTHRVTCRYSRSVRGYVAESL